MGRQERVALILPNSAEFVGLYFGCLDAGIVAVPINAGLHPRELVIFSTILELKPSSTRTPRQVSSQPRAMRRQESLFGA